MQTSVASRQQRLNNLWRSVARSFALADVAADEVLVHDEHRSDPSLAFALARLSTDDVSPTPFGVFRRVERKEYASAVGDQVMAASEAKGPGDLATLLRSNGTWTV